MMIKQENVKKVKIGCYKTVLYSAMIRKKTVRGTIYCEGVIKSCHLTKL